MAQQNVGFDMVGPQAIDRSYGALAQGRNIPYTSIAQATTTINMGTRYRGKTVIIDLGDGSGANEYWWRVGTADNQLVPKILFEQTIEFIIGDGGSLTPADGTTTYTNPALVNCKIYEVEGDLGSLASIVRAGAMQYFQYDVNAGRITLINAQFNTPNWWKIKYRQL